MQPNSPNVHLSIEPSADSYQPSVVLHRWYNKTLDNAPVVVGLHHQKFSHFFIAMKIDSICLSAFLRSFSIVFSGFQTLLLG